MKTNPKFLGQDLTPVSQFEMDIIFFKHLSMCFEPSQNTKKSESNSYINNDKTKVEIIAIENHLMGDLIDDHTFSSKFTLQLV